MFSEVYRSGKLALENWNKKLKTGNQNKRQIQHFRLFRNCVGFY